jgi:hypothetical protein
MAGSNVEERRLQRRVRRSDECGLQPRWTSFVSTRNHAVVTFLEHRC